MRIAINTRLLLKGRIDGIGLFTYESLKHLVVDHPNVEFIFIFDREPHPDFVFADNIKTAIISPQARHPSIYFYWYQYGLKRLLNKLKPDLFIGTDGMIPLKTKTKTLAVIHDLNFEHHPQHLPKILRTYYCKFFPKFANKSTRIATVSEFSKQDIVKTYQIDSSKIDVLYNGANENFKPTSKEDKTTILANYTDSKSYFLFIGTLHPRKNLINLFRAFDVFKTNTNSDIKLLIVGKKMWWTKEIASTFENLSHKSDVIFAGRVSEDELYKITASAYALTYIPVFEGFGIPLVEAMNSEIPIITSNVTSMPEVVGDAALLIDPYSVKEIAKGMEKLTRDKQLRDQLIEKGKIQSNKFSWKQTSDLLWNSIEKTLKDSEKK